MSDKLITVKLRRVEIEHLLNLLDDNERSGTYYGVREHYEKQHNDILSKLTSALGEVEREG